MSGSMHTIIYGQDMIKFIKTIDPERAKEIDPKGINVVAHSMLHNDQEIRALMLIKMRNSAQPMEEILLFPLDVWNKITHPIFDEKRDNEASH